MYLSPFQTYNSAGIKRSSFLQKQYLPSLKSQQWLGANKTPNSSALLGKYPACGRQGGTEEAAGPLLLPLHRHLPGLSWRDVWGLWQKQQLAAVNAGGGGGSSRAAAPTGSCRRCMWWQYVETCVMVPLYVPGAVGLGGSQWVPPDCFTWRFLVLRRNTRDLMTAHPLKCFSIPLHY